jgi:hypothetical protein
MKISDKVLVAQREKAIIKLAMGINKLMRQHKDRDEALDAYEIARTLFRRGREEYNRYLSGKTRTFETACAGLAKKGHSKSASSQ